MGFAILLPLVLLILLVNSLIDVLNKGLVEKERVEFSLLMDVVSYLDVYTRHFIVPKLHK